MPSQYNFAAAGFALSTSAILSFIDNFVASVAEEAGLWQFRLFRTMFALPMLLVASRMMGRSPRPVNHKGLIGHSLIVSFGLLIYFASVGNLPVAQGAQACLAHPSGWCY